MRLWLVRFSYVTDKSYYRSFKMISRVTSGGDVRDTAGARGGGRKARSITANSYNKLKQV